MKERVQIDRLVLNIPGMSVAQAREIGAQVGEALGTLGPCEHEQLAVSLDSASVGGSSERLAAHIVAEIRRQLG
jgi:hypothetical protein